MDDPPPGRSTKRGCYDPSVMSAARSYSEVTVLPRIAVHLPVALPAPPGFDPSEPRTWPEVTGRLEFVGAKLPAPEGLNGLSPSVGDFFRQLG
jgi:hypothetical protein